MSKVSCVATGKRQSRLCEWRELNCYYYVRRNKCDIRRKKTWAIELLQQKSSELGRLPKKEDFDELARSRIKAFLGPWPRALEAAGLKEAKIKPAKSKKTKKQTDEGKRKERL